MKQLKAYLYDWILSGHVCKIIPMYANNDKDIM